MQVIQVEIGFYSTNCYILYCAETLKAAIIDPAGQEKGLLELIEEKNLDVKYIINTHGHVDHIGANGAIKQAKDALILIHEEDAPMLTSYDKNLSIFVGKGVLGGVADKLINDGDIIEFGNVKLNVIHTPGHTKGGICLYNEKEKTLFSGDTLFAESIGRTDFPGGSYKTIIKSIKEKLFILPDETVVYPGHGEMTTIKHEKQYNPFVS
ncbi:MBL fold metallo-hydrolase [Selenomonadales bacterium OttesenSCG-928-I06]|nr:MBL fold metallo-hydrolase [Selenomonadales bacterium OttesenSCG-928-I06]